MCKNIVEKGQLDKPLIIFNRTEKRATDLSQSLPSGKSTVASSVNEVVSKSDIIFTCVGDDAASESFSKLFHVKLTDFTVNDTIDTALKGDVKGKLFVDCSTVHPETTEALGKKITSAGAKFVACPVFGAPASE
jgi:3-hydroxyisobutyrate dehydrogenase-like beta-hydroxyacid dehydrogenase